MRRRLISTLTLLLTGSICLGADPVRALSPDEVAANRALSQRMTQQAQLYLSTGSLTPANIRYSAAMLEGACQLDPTDPHPLRMLTEAYLQLAGDEGRDGAVKSLSRYLKIEPTDMGAMLRMIRLHFGQMESADKQREYVDQLLGTTVLAPELRGEIAVMGAKLALDRVEIEQSKKYVEQALKLFPLCPEALRLKFEQMDEKTPAVERLAVLLQMLRANPAQPYVMASVAQELAAGGMVDPAQTWYTQCFKLANRLGSAPDPAHGTAYAAELVIADQHQSAEPWIKGLVEQDPTSADAAFLDLLVARRTKLPEKIDSAVAAVQKALETRLSRISDVLNERQEPGSFDITEDVKKLQNAARLDLTSAYAAGLADLAWLKIYFESKPADAARYIEPLKLLLAQDSITLARLEGWAFLVDGKNDEARVKLSAVAGRDPLSALGMIRLDSADQPADKVQAQARALVTANAAGLMGAMLIEGVRDKLPLMPPGPDAVALKAELDKFDMRWLEILDLAKAKDFYLLKADPIKVAHKYGEPILVKVTIVNTGSFDITISPLGTLKPDIWVDVRVSRPEPRLIPGVAFDRMSTRLVLKRNESISQIVRVDAGPLVGMLSTVPTVEVPLYYAVLTNPMTLQGIVPGPAGYRVQFARVLVRTASPPGNDPVSNLNSLVQNGVGDVKIRTLDLLGTYVQLLRKLDDASAKTKATELADVVRKYTGDANPAVRAQAMRVTAYVSEPAIRDGVFQQMLSDNANTVRMVGLAEMSMMPEFTRKKEMAQPLAQNDADPLIKSLASAIVEVADLPPPATQPATQPSGGLAAPAPGAFPIPEMPIQGGASIPRAPADP